MFNKSFFLRENEIFFLEKIRTLFLIFLISLNDPFCSSIVGFFFPERQPFLQKISFVLKNVVRSKKKSNSQQFPLN